VNGCERTLFASSITRLRQCERRHARDGRVEDDDCQVVRVALDRAKERIGMRRARKECRRAGDVVRVEGHGDAARREAAGAVRRGDVHGRRDEAARAVRLETVPAVGEQEPDGRMGLQVERAAGDGEGRRREQECRDAGQKCLRVTRHYAPLEKP